MSERIDTLSQIKQLFARSSNSDPDVWESFLGVKVSPAFEHSDDADKQLTHNGHQCLEGGLSFFEQPLIEGLDDGVVLRGNDGRHIERTAQISIAALRDPGRPVDGRARLMLPRVEACVRHALPRTHIGWHRGKLAQETNGAAGSDAANRL